MKMFGQEKCCTSKMFGEAVLKLCGPILFADPSFPPHHDKGGIVKSHPRVRTLFRVSKNYFNWINDRNNF